MKFLVQIDCDNAAFDDRNAEVARILHELANKVKCGDVDNHIGRTQYRTLHDINGNSVGGATYQKGDDE